MASNLRRSKRTFGQRYLRTEQRASASSRNPAPRRIGARVITTNNIAPRSVTTVVLANDVVQDIEYAQAAANGKNTIYYSATEPSGGTYTEGDLWFETDNDNALARWDGAAWQSFGLGNAAFSNIDAGKITSGTISTAILFAGELTAARGTFGGFISAGNVQIGDGIYSNANYRGVTLDSGNSNNAWYVDTSTGNVYFKVGSATQYMTWNGTALNIVGTITGSTISGTTITTSTFSAGNPTGDGVSITGTQVLINTTGTTSSASLKFNTNAGSGTNYITGDKALEITTGGSSKTFINMGNTSGSGVGRVYAGALYFETYNAEVTRLTASVIGQNRLGSTVRVSDYYGVDISLSDELYAGRVTVTGALNVYGTKNFSIQHPLDEDRYLVHAAVEGPTADLIYRGTSSLENGLVEVELPRYFEAASKLEGRTVFITPKIADDGSQCNMAASSVENGKFTVSTQGCIDSCSHQFDWLVLAIRGDVETVVEPLKSEYNVRKEKEVLPEIDPNLTAG